MANKTELDPAYNLIPSEQMVSVLSTQCDIAPDFLGFTSIYIALAAIIPEHWTVVDLGCAYAPQAWVFKDHKAYIGVDFFVPTGGRFSAPNTTHFEDRIGRFCVEHSDEFDQGTTFAICSYVPPWWGDNMASARQSFKNVFTYYPCGGPREDVKFFRAKIAEGAVL